MYHLKHPWMNPAQKSSDSSLPRLFQASKKTASGQRFEYCTMILSNSVTIECSFNFAALDEVDRLELENEIEPRMVPKSNIFEKISYFLVVIDYF